MILDPIATALRSSDFDMTVHGNAKKKSKKGLEKQGITNKRHTGWDDGKMSKNSIEDGDRVTPF